MKKLLRVAIACSALLVVALIAAIFAGPASSGALLLLLPASHRPSSHNLPDNYTPVHHGHVSLDIGLYFRDNEDLIVPGTPALILRRSYVSSYRAPGQFGVGTTLASDWWLIGDGQQFQWAELVRPGESRIRFERTSPGTSIATAMFGHGGSASEWRGARLGWTGIDWAMRLADGTLARFRGCGPASNDRCSITSYRDTDGSVITYRRNQAGRLERVESKPDRWIAFDYDEHDRIVRAYSSTARDVRYEYDARGRLARVKSHDVVTHRYTYTDLDEMATIIEPGTDIENSYADGRCVRQVNRYTDGSAPYIFDFNYTVVGSRISATRSRESDGSWELLSFDKAGYTIGQTTGVADHEPATFTFERDSATHAVVSLTLTCPDRYGTSAPPFECGCAGPGRVDQVGSDADALLVATCVPADDTIEAQRVPGRRCDP